MDEYINVLKGSEQSPKSDGVFFPLLATREDKIKSVLFLFETYKYNSNIFAMCYKYFKKKKKFHRFQWAPKDIRKCGRTARSYKASSRRFYESTMWARIIILYFTWNSFILTYEETTTKYEPPAGHKHALGAHMKPLGVTLIGKFSTPLVFYSHFVKASKPIHMKSVLFDAGHPGQSWTDEYLR